jgi:hypothetical protein
MAGKGIFWFETCLDRRYKIKSLKNVGKSQNFTLYLVLKKIQLLPALNQVVRFI